MKSVGIGFIALAILSSCANRQFITVQSSLARDRGKGFVFKTDSVEIAYQFRGDGGSIQIDVQNKTTKPMFVDWSKSTIIMNGKVNAYWKNDYSVHGRTRGQTVAIYGDNTIGRQRIKGRISGMSVMDIIPPNSMLSKTPVRLVSRFVRQDNAKMEPISDKNNQKVFRSRYDSLNSPVQFRSYLTISSATDFKTVSTFDQAFWVSSIALGRKSLSGKIDDTTTTFYVKNKRNFGVPIAAAIIIGTLVAVTH
jgi:hypothetical protein